MAIDYKLVPFGSRAVTKRGYRAVVDNDGYVKDTDDILEETADRFGIKAPFLKMCMEAVLDTMIRKVADDGVRRRFGDYFTLRLDIKGRFDGSDSKLDGSQRPCFNMQLLGAFKKAARKVQLVNQVKRTRVYLKRVMTPENHKPGVIHWGLELCFTGKNLLPVGEGDYMDWSFTDAGGEQHAGTCDIRSRREKDKTSSSGVDALYAPWPEDMPRSAVGREVTFTYHSQAGSTTAEFQAHSASAVVMEVPR